MKIKHILKSQDFRDILKNGKKATSKEIAMYTVISQNKGVSVGIITPKRYISKAINRNYIRRVIYSHFREIAGTVKNGSSIVVRVIGQMNNGKRALSKKLREDLSALVKKVNITK